MKLPNYLKNFFLGTGLLTSILVVTDGLYNNLQGQKPTQITNTQIVNTINNITQWLKPEHKGEIQSLVNRTWNITSLYLEWCKFIDNQTPNFNFTPEEKFYAMVLVLDSRKTSKYYNAAKVAVEKNKNLQAITKRALKSVWLSIKIKTLQEWTSSIDDSIRAQKQIINEQKQTMNELNRLKKHIEEMTDMINNIWK